MRRPLALVRKPTAAAAKARNPGPLAALAERRNPARCANAAILPALSSWKPSKIAVKARLCSHNH
jgi:hypothetical protein